jgi:Tfp pilus assembly protein PilO
MVKINLKSSIPVKTAEKTKEIPKTPETPPKKIEKPPATEAEKIFTPLEISEVQPEPEFEEVVKETEFQFIPESKPGPARRMQSKPQEPLEVIEERWDDHYSSGSSKKNVLIIIGVILLVLLGSVGIYQLTDGLKNIPFFKKSKTAAITKTDQAIPAGDKVSAIPPAFQQNMAINQFITTQLNHLISKKSNTVRYSLIIISGSEINLTLVSDAENKITQFKNELNKEFPGLNFKTISSQKKNLNNTSMYFADLKSRVNANQSPVAGISSGNVGTITAFDSEMQNLAKKHKVNLEKIKSGKPKDNQTFSEKPYYLNFSGNRDNMINFINDIVTNYPSVRINKLALNPSNFITFSDNHLSARLNVSQINPK